MHEVEGRRADRPAANQSSSLETVDQWGMLILDQSQWGSFLLSMCSSPAVTGQNRASSLVNRISIFRDYQEGEVGLPISWWNLFRSFKAQAETLSPVDQWRKLICYQLIMASGPSMLLVYSDDMGRWQLMLKSYLRSFFILYYHWIMS